MDFDFDTPLPLRGSHASKYDAISRVFGSDDPEIIPMWVADMDFAAAPPILEALRVEVDRGYFGYFTNTAPADEAVAGWMKRRHGWEIDPNSVRYTHGVVNGYADVIQAYSDPGDAIIVFSPVYHAFFRQIRAMGREIVQSDLLLKDGKFTMDLETLEATLSGREKIVTLCSPHNPGGRLWTAQELKTLVAFCAAHDLILISDEIHMDLTFEGSKHIPTLVAAPEGADRTVVVTAASKSFNIAGGETGIAIIPDPGIRRKIDRVMLDRESSPNRFGMAMLTAAFNHGDDWMDAVCEYIAGNFQLFRDRINLIPGVRVMDMQSTYLSWVDFNGTGISDQDLLRRLVNDAKVAPSPGTQFENGGSGHMRFNVALPRPTLLNAIERIEKAFSDLQ